MNAKVVFSKDFEEKTKYHPMKSTERGRILMEKFNELTPEQISSAHTRKDLSRLLGYQEDQLVAGAQFIGRLVRKGLLKETLLSYGVNGHIEYEYCRPENTSPEGLEEDIEEEVRIEVYLKNGTYSLELNNIPPIKLTEIFEILQK